jgi:hypothetical protein
VRSVTKIRPSGAKPSAHGTSRPDAIVSIASAAFVRAESATGRRAAESHAVAAP